MSNKFSSLIDISSFFIGVLINLLLVAMICFYFKRKIDNLELSQSEQAKVLYQLVQSPPVLAHPQVPVGLDSAKLSFLNNEEMKNLESEQENTHVLKVEEIESEEDSDEDDSDEEDTSDDESVKEEKEEPQEELEEDVDPIVEQDNNHLMKDSSKIV